MTHYLILYMTIANILTSTISASCSFYSYIPHLSISLLLLLLLPYIHIDRLQISWPPLKKWGMKLSSSCVMSGSNEWSILLRSLSALGYKVWNAPPLACSQLDISSSRLSIPKTSFSPCILLHIEPVNAVHLYVHSLPL